MQGLNGGLTKFKTSVGSAVRTPPFADKLVILQSPLKICKYYYNDFLRFEIE